MSGSCLCVGILQPGNASGGQVSTCTHARAQLMSAEAIDVECFIEQGLSFACKLKLAAYLP